MAISVEQFGKSVAAAGLLTPDELKALWAAVPPAERPKSGAEFAKSLVAIGKLTEFQAKHLLSGSTIPFVLGDYLLLDKLGAGGMGQVFKAQHRRMNRIVALKVMLPEYVKDEQSVRRFRREVEAAARLEHPNIVAALDSRLDQGVHYLVMQFVDGADLQSILNKRGRLPVDDAVNYVLQAARGLAYAHSQGVIHRDIKPANLLLDKSGVVKVLDVGLARVEGAASVEGLTAAAQIMGTIDFMSPEQATDARAADVRSDIYSLGCTLWYLLTGQPMYGGETFVTRIMGHREAPIPSLAQRREEVSWPLEQVHRKMVAKRVEDRYANMQEVVADLEKLAVDVPAAGDRSLPNDERLSAFLSELQTGPRKSGPAAAALTAVNEPAVDDADGYKTVAMTASNLDTGAFAPPPTNIEAAVSGKHPVGDSQPSHAEPRSTAAKRRPVKAIVSILAATVVVGAGIALLRRDSVAPDVTTPAAPSPAAPSALTASPAASAAKSPAEPLAATPSNAATPPAARTAGSSSIAGAADRQAAVWALQHGARVVVSTLTTRGDTLERKIAAVADLPIGSFKLLEIAMPSEMPGNGDELPHLDQLRSLRVLELFAFSISPPTWSQLGELVNLRSLRVYGRDLPPNSLAVLKPLRKLTSLEFHDVPVASADLAVIDEFVDLRTMYLYDGSQQLTPDDVERILTNHPALVSLGINAGGKLDDSVFAVLAKHPNVIHVSLGGQPITDAGLQAASQLGHLRELRFYNNNLITDEGLSPLGAMSDLKVLWVKQMKIGDAAVEHLARMSGLTSLDISVTNVSDAGLPKLHGLKNLRSLNLRGTSVTAAGVAALQAALPDCKIDWSNQ